MIDSIAPLIADLLHVKGKNIGKRLENRSDKLLETSGANK